MRYRKTATYNPTIYDLGGHGGGIKGTKGQIPSGSPLSLTSAATQTYGYQVFQGGKGEDGKSTAGSGGGGYYGGRGGSVYLVDAAEYTSGGSGGSSFISGHPGCIAMNSQGSSLGTSIHPSGFFFENTITIQGNSEIPSPTSINSVEDVGHVGNGYVRITVLGSICFRSCNIAVFNIRHFLLILEFMFIC
ncbi:hypothetical protein TVAG_096500 [Trichomonas vaginalis G3]|uniref:receptor protein-tyrosine kinase n=1 Tax=Trichomonas vaginalis (strain ATCC PRA-98 / G3) TaxID=412133 RepID=A2F2U7_TRIV3|nr:glycine-rich protein family [Trichomonas vaginalis G3]EAY00740.1 hypothetical protein TVAG_096500 [Trichomonas vaginalis G3]KAI5530764.1 glycine-rich protein family [Trichomonas vaginalis G3]|eukprot:XP_001313669.1 hypothetical protein [Trichomonas vaginalis G3]